MPNWSQTRWLDIAFAAFCLLVVTGPQALFYGWPGFQLLAGISALVMIGASVAAAYSSPLN